MIQFTTESLVGVETEAFPAELDVMGIFELNSILDVPALKAIYYGHIYPHLKYGIICWENISKISSLFSIQKRALRCIARIDKLASCKPHFQSFRILTLTPIYILEWSLFVKKHASLF